MLEIDKSSYADRVHTRFKHIFKMAALTAEKNSNSFISKLPF